MGLLTDYITGNDKARDNIREKLKTEFFRRERRKIEERLRKDPLYLLKVMDIDKGLK